MKKKLFCAVIAAMMILIPVADSNTLTASAALSPDESGAFDRFDRIDDDLYIKTDEYWYHVNSDETATITRYTGSEKEVVVPSEIGGYTVTSIEGYVEYRGMGVPIGAFEDTDIVSLVIPDTVTEIMPELCDKCGELEKLVIGDSVEEIVSGSFIDLPKLKQVHIGSSVRKIGSQAFELCPELKEITIPANVEEIGEWAFGFINTDNGHEVDVGFTICCYPNTAGEEYAVSNGINYVLLNEPKALRGDVNSDGAVDIEDAAYVVEYINGEAQPSAAQEKLADIDKNGTVDIEDAVAVINHINGVKTLD